MYRRPNISYVSPKKRTGNYCKINKSFEHVAKYKYL